MIHSVPAISEASSPGEAIRITEEEGGALMRSVFDHSSFGNLVALYGVDLYVGQLEIVEGERSDAVNNVVRKHHLLAEIDDAMSDAGHPSFNLLSLLISQLGGSMPPHADNTFITEGISLLIPRSHTGDFALHGEGAFSVTEWEVRNGKITRSTDVREGGRGPFIERRSDYGRGDVLFLRQDMPYKGLKAKVHSAASKQNPRHKSYHREVITADHVVNL